MGFASADEGMISILRVEAGRGGLGECSQGLRPPRKQGLKGWNRGKKAVRADGEGVKIDQRPGRSIITTCQSSCSGYRIISAALHFLVVRKWMEPSSCWVVPGCSRPQEELSWMSSPGQGCMKGAWFSCSWYRVSLVFAACWGQSDDVDSVGCVLTLFSWVRTNKFRLGTEV